MAQAATSMPMPRAGDASRQALIEASLELFGRNGFEATSTRAIAKTAGVNIASIAYHFGGKEGLRTACARFIGETIRGVIGGQLPDAGAIAALSPEAAEKTLLGLARAMLEFMVARPESAAVARFAVREQMNPSAAFDVLYAEFFAPTHERLCAIWARATGNDAASIQTRLQVFTMIGQIIYFRLARTTVLRRMAWSEADASTHVEDIATAVTQALRASLREARHAA